MYIVADVFSKSPLSEQSSYKVKSKMMSNYQTYIANDVKIFNNANNFNNVIEIDDKISKRLIHSCLYCKLYI